MPIALGRSTAEHAAFGSQRTPLRSCLVLAILMLFYVLYFLDKVIFALLANHLAAGLDLSDLQLGLLQGFAYSIPYSVGVVAVGAAVDRFSRPFILFCGVFFWSCCAVASGAATDFGSLAAIRGGLGLGEAVLLPASVSLLSGLFPRERLGVALGCSARAPRLVESQVP